MRVRTLQALPACSERLRWLICGAAACPCLITPQLCICHVDIIHRRTAAAQLTTEARARRDAGEPVELVVDGKTLTHVLGDRAQEAALAQLGSTCTAVVVCRASPSQKANIVSMMREFEVQLVAGRHHTFLSRWFAKRRRKLKVRPRRLALPQHRHDSNTRSLCTVRFQHARIRKSLDSR